MAGLLFTSDGVPFTPSHAINHGRRYRYYIERSLLTPDAGGGKVSGHQLNGSGNDLASKGWRLPAHQIEQLVLKQLAAFLRDHGVLLDALRFKRKSPDHVSAVLGRASSLANRCDSSSFASHLEIINALVRRVAIAQDEVAIEIDQDGLIECLLDREAVSISKGSGHPPFLIEVPVRFRRRGVEAKLVVLNRQQAASEPDANLVKALARAHEWWGRIVRGNARGIGDIARAEGFNRAYVTRFLCLAFLAPELTNEILEGRQPTALTAKQLIKTALDVPLLWSDQHERFPVELGFNSQQSPAYE